MKVNNYGKIMFLGVCISVMAVSQGLAEYCEQEAHGSGWGDSIINDYMSGIKVKTTCYTDSSKTQKVSINTNEYEVNEDWEIIYDSSNNPIGYTSAGSTYNFADLNPYRVSTSTSFVGDNATSIIATIDWHNNISADYVYKFDENGVPVSYDISFTNNGNQFYVSTGNLQTDGNYATTAAVYDTDGNILMEGSGVIPQKDYPVIDQNGSYNYSISDTKDMIGRFYDYSDENNIIETSCNVTSITSLDNIGIDESSCRQKSYTRDEFAEMLAGNSSSSTTDEPRVKRTSYTIQEANEATPYKDKKYSIRFTW